MAGCRTRPDNHRPQFFATAAKSPAARRQTLHYPDIRCRDQRSRRNCKPASRNRRDFKIMSSKAPQLDAWGIMEAYEDGQHHLQRISKRNRMALRKTMGSIAGKQSATAPPPVLVLEAGKSQRLRKPVEIRLENGAIRQ